MWNTKRIGGDNPYASLAIVADTTPMAQFAAKKQLEEKAATAAATKYYNDLTQSLDIKGVRSQEAPIVNKATKDAIDFYRDNMDAINSQKDNGAKAAEYKKKIADVKALIASSLESKDLQAKSAAEIAKAVSAGKKVRKSQLAILDALDAPITDERHYKDPFTRIKYNEGDLRNMTAPLDPDKVLKDIIGLNKPALVKKGESKLNKQTWNRETPQASEYSKDSYDNILKSAASFLPQDQSFLNAVEDFTPNDYVDLNSIYSKETGKKLDFNNIPEIAKAWTMLKVPRSQPEKTLIESDDAYKMQQQKAKEKEMAMFTRSLGRGDAQEQLKWAYDHLEKVTPQSGTLPYGETQLTEKSIFGGVVPTDISLSIPIKDPTVVNSVKIKDSYSDNAYYNPKKDEYIFTFYERKHDGTYAYYKADAAGNIVGKSTTGELKPEEEQQGLTITRKVDNRRTVNLSKDQVVVSMAENTPNQKSIRTEVNETKKQSNTQSGQAKKQYVGVDANGKPIYK